MSTVPLERFILVVDSDNQFLETLKKDRKMAGLPLLTASKGAEAQLLLSDVRNRIAAVFVSPTVTGSPSWVSVIRCAYSYRPATPIYLITDERTDYRTLDEIDLRKLGVKEVIAKPVDYQAIMALVSPITLSFDAGAALEKASKNTDLLGMSALASDEGFIGIRAEDFLSGSKSFFDVYVRITAGKYLKLLEAGDHFTADRIENYLKKGVAFFYIKKEVQAEYLAYCDHLTTALLKMESVSIQLKASQTLNHGEETLKLLKSQGLSESSIQYATKFSSNVRNFTQQLAIQKGNKALNDFVRKVGAYEHGVGTSILAGLLGFTLKISNEKPVQILGIAGMLHDIALSQMPEKFWDEDQSALTLEEQVLFRIHPILSAKILEELKSVDPTVVQAVEQHHMRLGGQGFPPRSGGTPVSRVAEIIGICCEYNQLLKKAERELNLGNLRPILEAKVFPGFSRQLVQAFTETFFKNIPNPK